MKEQNVNETIQPIWRDLRQNHSTMYVVEEDIPYKKGTDKVGQEILRLVVPSSKRGHLLKLSHTPLADAHPCWKKQNSGKITQKFLLARHDNGCKIICKGMCVVSEGQCGQA